MQHGVVAACGINKRIPFTDRKLDRFCKNLLFTVRHRLRPLLRPGRHDQVRRSDGRPVWSGRESTAVPHAAPTELQYLSPISAITGHESRQVIAANFNLMLISVGS
jgi:hypothetical protein